MPDCQSLLRAIAVLAAMGAGTALAKSAPLQDITLSTLEPRIVRLERQLNPKHQLQLYQHLTTLQQELEALRGVVERQQHQLQQLEQRFKGLSAQPGQASTLAVAPSAAASETLNPKDSAKQREQARAAYEQAWQAVKSKSPSQAIQQLEHFIQTYPQSTYSPNAYYWLGQLLFRQGEATRASHYFATVLRSFPKSNKVSDAMLKIGIITQGQGDIEKAKAIYGRVVKQYANSPAAEQAQQRLAKLP
ncbi:MAG: tol-pal system protein YbgF [Candidatus Symbiodolus clandestinus]